MTKIVKRADQVGNIYNYARTARGDINPMPKPEEEARALEERERANPLLGPRPPGA